MGDRAEHTAGPWVVSRKLEVGPRSDADDQSFGMVVGVCDVYGDNAEADARLIAAAPDLLGIVREMLQSVSDGTWEADRKWFADKARAAISRATGEA